MAFLDKLYGWLLDFMDFRGLHYFTECANMASNGFYLAKEEHCPFNYMMQEIIGKSEMKMKIYEASTHLERLTLIQSEFPSPLFRFHVNDLDNVFQKDINVATTLEDKAIRLAKKSYFGLALRHYNLAAGFAPETPKCIGRIYAKRAILLQTMKKSKACLLSVELALSHECPDRYSHELIVMKNECKLALYKKNEVKMATQNVISPEQKFRDEVILKVSGGQNPKITSGSNSIRIKANAEKGRYLVTEDQLDPGTTLIVEDYFIGVLNNSTTFCTTHCANCFKTVRATIPCPNCVFANYCSEKCRLDDLMDGHCYECACYGYLHGIRISPTLHMAFKMICRQGPENLYKLWVDKLNEPAAAETTADKNTLISGLDTKTGVYESNSYHQILNLKSHADKATLPALTWTAYSLMKVLDHKTSFFPRASQYDYDEFKKFVASLILQHAISFPYNAITLNGKYLENTQEPEDEEEPATPDRLAVATVIYPLVSLMNHSCAANVFRVTEPNGRIAIVTNRKILAGDEITFSWGFSYVLNDFEERKLMVKQRYNFECKCAACTLKWTTFSQLNCADSYLCPRCIVQSSWDQSEVHRCALKQRIPYVGLCPNCRTGLQMTAIVNEAERCKGLLELANQLNSEGRPLEAIPWVLYCILFFGKHLCPPSRDLMMAQVLLSESYDLICSTKY